jgi:type IV pilus assembly protein PilW
MRRARGFSITELLVAVAIGTLLTMSAVALLISAGNAYLAHTDAAEVDAAGRVAMAAIAQAARQTGLGDAEVNVNADAGEGVGDGGGDWVGQSAPAIIGLDAASLSSDSDGIGNPRPAAVNGSDVLALRFGGSGGGGGDGSVNTCAGFSVGAGQQGWSIFYVGASAGGLPELRCKYRGANNWSAEAVVGGVDSFQVLYGIDTDPVQDGQANRFVTASAINGMDAGAHSAYWKRVVSIKVSLALHGAHRSKRVHAPGVLHLFGAAYSALGGDEGVRVDPAAMAPALRERERRTFSSIITLRNPQRGAP